MAGVRKKITLTIWQWPTGELTAFLDSLRVDGEHLEMEAPKMVAQAKAAKNATPSEVLRALADAWDTKPGKAGPTPPGPV